MAADSALIFTWGNTIDGREQMGLGVFMQSMDLHKSYADSGKIESYDFFINSTGNTTVNQGSLVVKGSPEQIRALENDEDYQRVVTKAMHVVDNLTVIRADTGTRIPMRIERLQAARKELGITD